MIKNEEKYLENTLKSIINMKNKIEIEIVILDTGSKDKSISIAKKYTDKIYFKDWNNNFAEMRNESIKYAKGDWILVVDADEELVEYDKLVSFFENNTYKKFNSASIEIKNIHCENEEMYSMGSVVRLFKNTPEFKYEGSIHEQPLYNGPTYNNIAKFNHYGYMYGDEEVKNKKLKRNEELLLKELNKNQEDPYVNFQLAQNYMAYGKPEEALEYLEKSHKKYKKMNNCYEYVENLLAKLYLELEKYRECKTLCEDYIKKDDKNIDIYLYRAMCKKNLLEYEQALDDYNRYIYLIENYEISTQANNIYCQGHTICFLENAKLDMIDINYELNNYKEVIRLCRSLNREKIKSKYIKLLLSLYNLNKIDEIILLYKESESKHDKVDLTNSLEQMITNFKKVEKNNVFDIFKDIDDNYGSLNKLRIGYKLPYCECKKIIMEEKEWYYGDVLYYAYNSGLDLAELLSHVSYIQAQNYMNYIITNRRDIIIELYDYLLKESNTLDMKKLSIYSCIAKTLLLKGNLADEKYKNLFFMYKTYQYDYMKQLYNDKLSDNEILKFLIDEDDIFIFNINLVQEIKKIDKLKYIKEIKRILVDKPKYKSWIQILIDEFTFEYEENEELKSLKVKYKELIEQKINLSEFDKALSMIEEYESIFTNDKLYNMRAIINMYSNNIEESERLLKLNYIKNSDDVNGIFNIGYIKEFKKEYKDAIKFYKKVLNISTDEKLNEEILSKIDYIINTSKES